MKCTPFGNSEVPVSNSGLVVVTIERKEASAFIKATGPRTIVKIAEKDMKTLIANALKK